MKTVKQTNPPLSINRLAEVLGVDRRTVSKAIHTEEVKPAGAGPSGPLYRKSAVITALHCAQRERQGFSPTKELAEMAERNTFIMSIFMQQHPEEFAAAVEEVDEMLWRRENGK